MPANEHGHRAGRLGAADPVTALSAPTSGYACRHAAAQRPRCAFHTPTPGGRTARHAVLEGREYAHPDARRSHLCRRSSLFRLPSCPFPPACWRIRPGWASPPAALPARPAAVSCARSCTQLPPRDTPARLHRGALLRDAPALLGLPYTETQRRREAVRIRQDRGRLLGACGPGASSSVPGWCGGPASSTRVAPGGERRGGAQARRPRRTLALSFAGERRSGDPGPGRCCSTVFGTALVRQGGA